MKSKPTNPIVCVDALVFRKNISNSYEILMVTRKHEPFKGGYAFPGGHVDYNEDPQAACLRELREETSLIGENIELFAVKGKPDRDPRGHTISIFYIVQVAAGAQPKACDDAETAKFYNLIEIMKDKDNFAFDHYEVLEELVKKRLS